MAHQAQFVLIKFSLRWNDYWYMFVYPIQWFFFIGLCYWFRILSHFDCGGSYDIRVELLDQKKQLIEIFSLETIYCGTGREEWKQVWQQNACMKTQGQLLSDWLFVFQITHVFHKYGPGVGYIRFTRRGRDLRWWKGHFGIHITGSSELFPTLDT